MKDEEIDKMADDFVNAQEFTKVYGLARKAECGAFWKYGFLAGLKAGRPQWHNLRENPNDLPTEEKEYLVYTKEWGVEIRNYFTDDNYFSCRRNMVIAWCEIPTFDKE